MTVAPLSARFQIMAQPNDHWLIWDCERNAPAELDDFAFVQLETEDDARLGVIALEAAQSGARTAKEVASEFRPKTPLRITPDMERQFWIACPVALVIMLACIIFTMR